MCPTALFDPGTIAESVLGVGDGQHYINLTLT
jgi:hypothetical protein